METAMAMVLSDIMMAALALRVPGSF